MNMNLKTLTFSTLFLFAASIAVYIQDNKQGTSPVEGSYLVRGLDVNGIHRIVIEQNKKTQVDFERSSQGFELANHEGYPANILKVNDLIYDISSFKIKEDSGIVYDKDSPNVELFPKSSKTIKIYDNDNKNVLSLKIGKTIRGNQFIANLLNNKIYLIKGNQYIHTDYKNYLETELISDELTELEQIDLLSDGINSVIKKTEEGYQLDEKEFKETDINQFKNSLKNLRFSSFYSPLSEIVKGLNFNEKIKVIASDKVVYQIQIASSNDKYFIKLQAKLNDVPSELVIRRDASKDELADVEKVFKAQSKAQQLNQKHANWVYEISKSSYEQISKLFKSS